MTTNGTSEFTKIPSEYYPKHSTKEQHSQKEMSPSDLPITVQHQLESPAKYIAGDGLTDALNVALILGQPLLLTGEPGTGKTQFAYSAMHWLGFSDLIRFNVKSTTQASDFFYKIDEIKRFRDAQLSNIKQRAPLLEPSNVDSPISVPVEPDQNPKDLLELRNYMTLGPLGEAILRANPPNSFPNLTQPKNHTQQQRSIVLIDEIDKAPRDVPNDLLNEFENMEFEVPELNKRIEADQSYRPVLIITSNSERNLPDAFLRRCIFYNIPFPGEDIEKTENNSNELKKQALIHIVEARIPAIKEDTVWLKEALELFCRFREPGQGIQKRPGTAELLNWLLVLHRREDISAKSSLKKQPEFFKQTLSILMKNSTDSKIAHQIFNVY